MRMIQILVFTAITLLITACSEALTAKKIISNSIQFHDPNLKWTSLNQTLSFDSRFSFNDSVPEEMHLTFNNGSQEFTYNNLDRAVKLHYTPDTCYKKTSNGDCNGYKWTYGFYPFIWGLPMKLEDPGVEPESSFKATTFNNLKVWEVQINYTAENYWFYFDKTNYQLRGFKFIKNDNSKKGEIIVLNNLLEVNGIKFPKHRTWLHLDSSLIGTNEVIKLVK